MTVDGVGAMRELMTYEERVGRADVDSREAFQERAAEASGVLATLIGADPDAVDLVPGRHRGHGLGRRHRTASLGASAS